jgi:hypothetical protein
VVSGQKEQEPQIFKKIKLFSIVPKIGDDTCRKSFLYVSISRFPLWRLPAESPGAGVWFGPKPGNNKALIAATSNHSPEFIRLAHFLLAA